MEITKQTTMGQMLDYDRGIAYVLMQSDRKDMSKILLINGSPNEHGCTYTALSEIAIIRSRKPKPHKS